MSKEHWHAQVHPICNPSVRDLCRKPYPGHPRGCPNYGRRRTCPPHAPMLCQVIDLSQPVHAVWNAFDLAGHVERMREKHPEWSDRQLVNCLYWQGTARKALRAKVRNFGGLLLASGQLIALACPEACGVNVTATLASIGIEIEWPPKTIAYQVALVGAPATLARDDMPLFPSAAQGGGS